MGAQGLDMLNLKNKLNKKVIILGDAIGAQVMSKLLKQNPTIEIAAYAVNAQYHNKKEIDGTKVYPLENLLDHFPANQYQLVNGLGYSNVNRNREIIFHQAKEMGYQFLTYIDSKATALTQSIGEGVFIMPGAVIEPYASIGANTVIWSNSTIAHHVIIEENCWIASGVVIAGGSKIKKNAFLGVNSTIVDKVTVYEANIIGAGALITKSTCVENVFLARSGEKHRFDSENYAKFFNK